MRRTLTLVVAALALSACEDEITGPGETFTEGEILVDASSPVSFTYVTLDGPGSVVTVADPATSEAWDLAFRRFALKLNGGVAGPGSVAAASLGTFADATADQVVALTRADADAAFEAVTEADAAAATFETASLAEDTGGSWFRFDPQSGTLVANPGAAWKVRTGEGGHGVFRVAAMTLTPQSALETVTVEFRYQEAGGTLGPIQSVELSLAMGPAFLDLSSAAPASPAGCGWDLTVQPSFSIGFNGDCDAGSFPLDAATPFDQVGEAGDAPEYAPFLSVISGPIPNTVDDATGLFWYNIEGGNRLWPTYNVFLVREGDAVYKVQVLDYYDASGESGHPTVRFQRLQ